jgi:hypothetical protein
MSEARAPMFTFLIQYSSDQTRSAGDMVYKTLSGALSAYRAMCRAHPDALMGLYRWDGTEWQLIKRHGDLPDWLNG